MARSVPSKFNDNLHGQKVYFRKRIYPNHTQSRNFRLEGPYIRKPALHKCKYLPEDNINFFIEEVEEYVMVTPGATIEF